MIFLDIMVYAVMGIIIILGSLILSLFLKGIDRKVAARMQGRVGPPLRQPFRDVSKLMQKENIIPDDAVGWVFDTMPALALVSTLAIILYLPLGPLNPVLGRYGDLILIIYLFALPALAMALGGFSSGSPVGAIGAQREMVIMMSYEFPLAIIIFTRAWVFSGQGLAGLALDTYRTNPIWGMVGVVGAFGLILLILALLAVIPGELAKIPFDQAEAETELADGVLVEYSGRNLGLFYIADAMKTLALASLFIALFLPWSLSPMIANYVPLPVVGGYAVGAWLVNMGFFFVKLVIVIFFTVSFVRVAMPRLQINRASSFYLFTTSALATFGSFLIFIDKTIGGAW